MPNTNEAEYQRIIDEITGVISTLDTKFEAKLDTVLEEGRSTNKRLAAVEDRTAKLEQRVDRHSTSPSKPDLEREAKLSEAIIASKAESDADIAKLREQLERNTNIMASVDKHLGGWTNNPIIKHSVTAAILALAGYVVLHCSPGTLPGQLPAGSPVPSAAPMIPTARAAQ